MAFVELPHHVAWNGKQSFDLSKRDDRRRAYEIVLTDGLPVDTEAIVDGALLIDLGPEMHVPRPFEQLGYQ